MIALAVWALLLPFRVAALLGLRRSLVVGCLLVLGITVYGVAEDLGVLAAPRPAPAKASAATCVPTKPSAQVKASAAAKADIPARYLTLYQREGQRCGVPWTVLAAIGKIESDHGRSRAPGVRSGVNRFGCCAGPMQFNLRNGPPSTWDRYGRGNVYNARDAIAAAARYLRASGARTNLRKAIYAYNHSRAYVAQVLAAARRYQAPGGAR